MQKITCFAYNSTIFIIISGYSWLEARTFVTPENRLRLFQPSGL